MRKHSNRIYGIMLRPCSTTQIENEKVIHSSDLAVKSDFRKEYSNHIAGIQLVAECGKIYILKNWKKVKNWSDLRISIIDNSGKETYYYKYVKSNVKCYSKFAEERRKRMDSEDKRSHNPVKKISDVVLDPTDGDFSIKINGRWHNWIDKESVIVLADYIEKQLKNKNTKK